MAPDMRILNHQDAIHLYTAPKGANITATTEYGGNLYVALHHETGKNEIVIFELDKKPEHKSPPPPVPVSNIRVVRMRDSLWLDIDGDRYTVTHDVNTFGSTEINIARIQQFAKLTPKN